MEEVSQIERCKPDFDENKMKQARDKTWEVINQVAEEMRPGISEREGQEKIVSLLQAMGSTRNWHRPHLRFGRNTLKTLSETSEPEVFLEEDDIFFFDLGPVWDGYEGDAGRSFVIGKDPEKIRCVKNCEEIFNKVAGAWKESRLSGERLYKMAEEESQKRGWILNLRGGSGHRLADFPHALYFKGTLADRDFTPTACRWVLEIQIRHPSLPFGAFYEDLLL